MTTPLRILHLEDSPADAELVLAALDHEAIACHSQRVETKAEFEAALNQGAFDLVLSDFSLPSFDGLSALKISRVKAPETPFIFVSGTIGEERAIETLKAGATDYVLKHRLSRLAPAVRRAIEEIAERVARQEAVRSRAEAESLFRALFDQVAVGVAIAALDTTIVKSNPMLTALLGYGARELQGKRLDDLTHPADRQKGAELLGDLHAGKRISVEIEKRFIRKDGKTLLARVVSSVIEGTPGAAGFVVNLIEDIAERKELESQLRQAQKMEAVGRLAAGVAHDFNNFLTVINGYSDLLVRRVPEEDPMRDILQQIRSAGERASTLCARLLAFSRQQTPRPAYLDLNAMLRELQPMLGQLAAERVRLTLKLTPGAAPVHADRMQIEQAVINLISNARDAMPDGGEITIQTERADVGSAKDAGQGIPPGCYVVLDVADTGEGMDEDVKSRIFEPFFTTKQSGKGTGLGLWMVCETVQQSHGFLGLQSVRGAGTSFRIYLPWLAHPGGMGLAELGRSLETDLAPARAPRSSHEATIVIADDDQAIRDLLQVILTDSGYRVLTASNGHQALETLRTEKSTLLITDLVMPDKEGIETIIAVRKEFPALRIIAMSGSHGTPYLQIAKRVGAHAILSKPFDRKATLETVDRVLDTSRDPLASGSARQPAC